jgi:hypothetical protein
VVQGFAVAGPASVLFFAFPWCFFFMSVVWPNLWCFGLALQVVPMIGLLGQVGLSVSFCNEANFCSPFEKRKPLPLQYGKKAGRRGQTGEAGAESLFVSLHGSPRDVDGRILCPARKKSRASRTRNSHQAFAASQPESGTTGGLLCAAARFVNKDTGRQESPYYNLLA